MSAGALFVPTTEHGCGEFWLPAADDMRFLPRSQRNAAENVMKAIAHALLPGKTATTEAVTDRWLKDNCPSVADYSLAYIQKGLRALSRVMTALGMDPWIERIRQHGRRIIIVLVRFRGRAEKPAAAEAAGKGKSAPVAGSGPMVVASVEAPPVVVPDPDDDRPAMSFREMLAGLAKASTPPEGPEASRPLPPASTERIRKATAGLADPRLTEAAAELAEHNARRQAERAAREAERAARDAEAPEAPDPHPIE